MKLFHYADFVVLFDSLNSGREKLDSDTRLSNRQVLALLSLRSQ